MTLVDIQYHPPCTYHKDGDHRERQGYYLCDCGASSAWHKTVPVESETNRVYQSEAYGALRIINRNGDVIDTVTDIHRKVYFGDAIGDPDAAVGEETP